MSNELVLKEQNHTAYIDKVLHLIPGQAAMSKTDLENFALQCKRTGLDPITRQIYAIPSGGKMTIMASIDGLRLIAERSGAYEGQTAPQWCDETGAWTDVWLKKVPPTACKIGVYKTKFREPLIAIALFDEYAGRYAYDDKHGKYKKGDLTHMWAKMPALMIAKVAEALALRKAFPNEMSGIYSTEEMEQADILPAKDVSPQIQEPKKHIVEKVAEIKETKQGAETLESLGEYVVTFGKKLSGQKLKNIDPTQLESYVFDYLEANSKKTNHPLTGAALELFEKGSAYLKLFVNHDSEPPQPMSEELFPD
jgi:phage recombination protein Bet